MSPSPSNEYCHAIRHWGAACISARADVYVVMMGSLTDDQSTTQPIMRPRGKRSVRIKKYAPISCPTPRQVCFSFFLVRSYRPEGPQCPKSFLRIRPATSMPRGVFVMRSFFAYRQKASSYWGGTGCQYLISLSVYVCVTVVVFTDCEG